MIRFLKPDFSSELLQRKVKRTSNAIRDISTIDRKKFLVLLAECERLPLSDITLQNCFETNDSM